jgi:error-prone DNA polymerase
LDILHADVSAHLLDPWRPFLDDLGVTYANDLLSCRANSTVLVAGVRVASGTPPTRTGKRVAFISLDDGTGISDIAFFDDAQHSAGPHLFASHLMLVQGRTRRTGPRGISITATTAWDLTTLKEMKPQRQ